MEKTKVTTQVWNKIFPLRIGDYILVKGTMLSFRAPKIATLKIEKIFSHKKNKLGISYEVMRNPNEKRMGIIGGSQDFEQKDILEIIRREDYEGIQ